MKIGQVIVNGKSYQGSNITVNNNNIIIDGETINFDKNLKKIDISVHGNIENLSVDFCDTLKVEGNVNNSLTTISGDVKIVGDVNGNISTVSGDVDCKSVKGSVKTVSGDISNK